MAVDGGAAVEWLSIRQAVDYLNGAVGKTLLYDLLSKGILPSSKLGRKILVCRADLDALLERNRKGGGSIEPPPPAKRQSKSRPSRIERW